MGNFMSKLNVEQKSIFALLSDKKADFLIPDYQRPYAWNEEQCQTLWEDITLFAFPDNDYNAFNDSEEYFLGSIVTYKNEKNKSEVIDGQQRLTTLMLLLRAFYDKFANAKDQNAVSIRDQIEKCIWKTNVFGTADKNALKIDSEVATDNDKQEFLEILRTGIVGDGKKEDVKSQYVLNFQFFEGKIQEFLLKFPTAFPFLPARILQNCILLPIEAESQDTALRIFSTLNNRGLPLSDTDIFKAQFYKYYGNLNKKDEFITAWKDLEKIAQDVFDAPTSSAMDELFTYYMYFLRAKEGQKSSTTEALRKFYERNQYRYLKNPTTLEDLKALAGFWESVADQDRTKFSEKVLKKLFVLHYAPNGMWKNITSVYFLKNKDMKGILEENAFCKFLDKITAFIFAYAVTNPGVNALRTPVYDEMVTIISGDEVTFSSYKFTQVLARMYFEMDYTFTHQKSVTRSMVTWYAYTFAEQKLLSLNEKYDLEHIYPKKRQDMEGSLTDRAKLEALGNKVLLEHSINIKASDYRFEDKKKIYSGAARRGSNKSPSNIHEISELAQNNDFQEQEIIDRTKKMIDTFFEFLKQEDLLIL